MKSAIHCFVLALLCWTSLGLERAYAREAVEPQEMAIEMPDGATLAADIYFPHGYNTGQSHPVLLEYLPYRKTESRGYRASVYDYFLRRGYVVVRVDIRGTGNSQGRVIPYEYSDIELNDGEAVIGWLSRQPWSTGNVGMFGISWGGFNAIQLAMRNPPALKAFVALMATEDLYREDVHYIDGIMHTDSWMMSNDLDNSLPGAPNYLLDDDWLHNRFEAEPSVFTYMRHQRDGAFWRRASALGRQGKIKVPGLHIGGWYDGYRNSIPRMLEHAGAPTKAIIGPWDHEFPHDAVRAPQIEWRHEAVRWFDHWLKGIDDGVLKEPKLAVFMRHGHPPNDDISAISGAWRWEAGWPVEDAEVTRMFPTGDHSLSGNSSDLAQHKLSYKASVGLEGGGPVMWWGSFAPDQQKMDDHSLVYDSAALSEPLGILGHANVQLQVSASASRANWIVRLSDIAPDGSVTQITGAAINGTHRFSASDPTDIVPGEVFPLDIKLHVTSWVFRPGHRIRLAVSNAMWPMLWPTPYPMETTLMLGEGKSWLDLPVVPVMAASAPEFEEPEVSPELSGFGALEAGNTTGFAEIDTIYKDKVTGEVYGFAKNASTYRYPWGTSQFEEKIEHRTSDENPAKTSVFGNYAVTKKVTGRTLRVEQDVTFSSDAENFRLIFVRRFLENGVLRYEKTWDEIFPRDFQ
ncbi:MAG: CocE/NonD family hydrolase [Alphaproteobacteria bacterium]|nr:CocE/NonD family hydrolase [Alphaproteobacteria bacterium]